MWRHSTGLLCLCVLLPIAGIAQLTRDSTAVALSPKLSNQYIAEVGSRATKLDCKIYKATAKYLASLQNQETDLQRILARSDSSAAKRIFSNSTQQYSNLEGQLKNNEQSVIRSCGKYIPALDTAITSLKFLSQSGVANSALGVNVTKIQSAVAGIKGLETQFNKADNVEDFIRQRKEYLKQQLAGYPNLTAGLEKYKQQAYYYGQQINEYKETWNDPSKIEQKAVGLLNRVPDFQAFVKKNSFLAGLFNIPDDYANTTLPPGLQTREQVQTLIQQQLTTMGPGGAQTASQNISDGQSMLSSLRTKFQQTGSGGELPDFKPNNQKSKAFLKRLEFGFNMQSTKSNAYFPAQTNFAVTVGYKLSDKNSFGVGMSYLVGWGQPVRQIHISSQGLGFRSYLDIGLKKGFSANGGFEYNYNQAFTSLSLLKTSGIWQRSALVGISKEVSVKSSFLKKTRLQLLWDMLSYSQIPRTKPLVFRVGYSF